MTYRDWLPTSWLGGKEDTDSPLYSLQKQINTLLDDFGSGPFPKDQGFTIRSNVSETDSEVCITAELPGIAMEDVDVSVTGNRITIKGEKKSEKDEKKEEEGRQFHRIERSSGSFYRMMTLPFEIDPDSVKAGVKDGILTVTVPKPSEIVEKTKKIKVEKEG